MKEQKGTNGERPGRQEGKGGTEGGEGLKLVVEASFGRNEPNNVCACLISRD